MCENEKTAIRLPVVGYEGLYEVDSLGNVYSVKRTTTKGGKLKPQLSKGYCRVALSKNGVAKRYFVHRLVAKAFIPNPFDLPQVNHKDERKTNNRVENLEWCTAKYNTNYADANEKRSITLGKKVLQILNGIIEGEYNSTREAARQTGYLQPRISDCCRGILKTYKGFIWRYG